MKCGSKWLSAINNILSILISKVSFAIRDYNEREFCDASIKKMLFVLPFVVWELNFLSLYEIKLFIYYLFIFSPFLDKGFSQNFP
jgi:hypothetical protein